MAHQQNAIQMAFCWLAVRGSLLYVPCLSASVSPVGVKYNKISWKFDAFPIVVVLRPSIIVHQGTIK